MGNKQSKTPGVPEVRVPKLTAADVARLQRRFLRLAGGAQGAVSVTEFQNIVELGGNPFIQRIFQVCVGCAGACIA